MKPLAIAILAWTLGLAVPGAGAADAKTPMSPNDSSTNAQPTSVATLGGGCFWCLDAVFRMVNGVKSVTCGYAGGHTENPTYKQVCEGDTGHAEVIQIVFDPAQVSYDRLLEVFWECHDPTTLNRQGHDVGSQYRSVILYHDETQRLAAEKSKAAAQKRFKDPVVTEIVPLAKFYPAEAYHQDYFRNNPSQGYCRVVIAPKVEKMKKQLAPGH